MHGRYTWYELYTTDMAGAKKFYPALTGWGVQGWDQASDDNPYEMWTANGEPFAGLMPLTAEMKAMGAPPHWLAYVEVQSAGDTIAKITSMGGDVVWGPETIPNVGTLAVFKDPQGAISAILQPAQAGAGYDGKPVIGKPSWHELMTSDYKQAFDFYSALFGWTKVAEEDIGGGMKYLTYASHTGKVPVGGMFNRMPGMEGVPPNWLIYTHHRDAKGASAAITRNGGKVINGPMEVPGGDWIVAFTDPQGVAHALHTAKTKAAAPAKKAKPATKKKSKPKKSKKDKKKAEKKAKKAKKKDKKEKKKDKKKKKR